MTVKGRSGWVAGRDDSEGEEWADRWWAEMTVKGRRGWQAETTGKGRSGLAGRDDSEGEERVGR